MRTVRSEVPTPVPETAGGWRPSASAALASLVKDEIDALSKPDAPPPAPEPVAAPRGLLEVPPPTGEVPAASVNGRPARNESPTPVTAVERPPTFTPAYPYATRPAKPQGNKGLLIGIGVAVLVVLAAVGGGGWYLLQRQKASEVAVRQTPPAPEPAKVTPPEPPRAAQAHRAQPAASASATPAVTPLGDAAGGQGHTGRAAERGHGTGPGVEPAAPATAAAARRPAGATSRSRRPTRPRRARGTARARPTTCSTRCSAPAAARSPTESRSNGKKTAYVPPAPGSSNTTEVPDRLPKGDIMSVVLANKPSIVRCVNEQKTRDPNLHGTLVMHWVIQTSGKTSRRHRGHRPVQVHLHGHLSQRSGEVLELPQAQVPAGRAGGLSLHLLGW